MATTHSWKITGLFTHNLNKNCVNKITAELTSDIDGSVVKTNHEFFVAPNHSPVEFEDEEGNPLPTPIYHWFDEKPEFTPISSLKEENIWKWIDERYDRKKIERENDPTTVEETYSDVKLPW